LPAHLLSFQGERNGNWVQLKYQINLITSQEIIKIQKSYNGYDWLNVAQAQGNIYTDIETSDAYYRLAFCDVSCSYSTAIFVGGINSIIRVLMSREEIIIEGLEGSNYIQIHDINGKMLFQTATDEKRLIIKKQFVAGVYIIKILSQTGLIQHFKISAQ